MFALIAWAPEDETGSGWQSAVATVIALAVMLTATLMLIGLRREVYQSGHGVRPDDPRPRNRHRGPLRIS